MRCHVNVCIDLLACRTLLVRQHGWAKKIISSALVVPVNKPIYTDGHLLVPVVKTRERARVGTPGTFGRIFFDICFSSGAYTSWSSQETNLRSSRHNFQGKRIEPRSAYPPNRPTKAGTRMLVANS